MHKMQADSLAELVKMSERLKVRAAKRSRYDSNTR